MSSAAPVYLSKEVYGTEKGEPEMPIKNVTFDSGFMLYNPKWKIHSDSLVPQEVEAFGFSIGLEQIPEVTTNPHCYSLAESITIGIELGVVLWWFYRRCWYPGKEGKRKKNFSSRYATAVDDRSLNGPSLPF